MKPVICILSILILLSAASCQQKEEQKQSEQVIKCEYSEKDFLKLSEFAESVEIIPLETSPECLFDEFITKMKKQGDKYYISCGSMFTTKILVFDENGRFIYKLNKKGQGPGEYLEIEDYTVIDNTRIAVISHSRPCIYIYDIEKDTCLMQKDLDIYPDNFILKDSCFYMTKNGTKYKETEENNLIRVFDFDGNYLKSFFHIDSTILKINSNIGPAITLSKNENDLFFIYPFCDTIFKIGEKDDVIPAFIYDFWKKSIDRNKLSQAKGIKEIEKIIEDNNLVFSIMYYSVQDNYIFSAFSGWEINGYISFYNRKTHKTRIAHHIIDDMYLIGNSVALKAVRLPKLIDDGYLYYFVDPGQLMNWFYKFKTKVPQKLRNTFCNDHPHFMEIMNKLKEDDNPLLLKIKLKNKL